MGKIIIPIILHNIFYELHQSILYICFSDGRQLSFEFINLPLRRERPDYYDVIAQPISLNKIKKKIRDERYTSLNQLTADIKLLCQNAQVLLISIFYGF